MKIRLEEKHYQWGLTAFLVIICSVAVFFAIYKFAVIRNAVAVCTKILAPFLYGMVMAYLLCPIYNFTVRNTYTFLRRKVRWISKSLAIAKGIGTIVAMVVLILIISGILWMIVPGLIESIMAIIEILPSSMDNFSHWVNVHLSAYPQAQMMLSGWINNFTENAINFVMNTVLPEYSSIVTSVSEGLMSVISGLKNFFIGIIICAYFLNSKDTFAAQSKKIILAIVNENTAKEILAGSHFANKTFGGFINGKIIDSFIIGCICFVMMSIFGWEYSLLISCIIGITNIIPFFGPFIGAVPSALLLLMVDPKQCIWFLVFILLLQQFDGNILGPKILGDSTGLPSFWILFAVLVGGGLFGFVGMVIGIPVFAILYAYTSRGVNHKLEEKGFSTETADYKIDSYRVRRSGRTQRKWIRRKKKITEKQDGK